MKNIDDSYSPDELYAIGSKYFEVGSIQLSIKYFEKSLLGGPFFEGLHDLGVALSLAGRHLDGIKMLENAVSIKREPGALYNIGRIYDEIKDFNSSSNAYKSAIDLNPHFLEAWVNYGVALYELGLFDKAILAYDKALEITPCFLDALLNKGNALHKQKKFIEAIDNYEQAILINGSFADAHFNKSMTMLLMGDFEVGLKEYEWRHQCPALQEQDRLSKEPIWTGKESLKDKTILLFSEQGYGDTIQFCRYAKLIGELGAKVILEVQGPLVELLSNVEGVSQILAKGSLPPMHDYQCSLLSLPLAFGTTLKTIPDMGKYLCSNNEKAVLWQSRIGCNEPIKIGLAWSGNRSHANDRYRSIPVDELLSQLPKNIQYYSLQKEIPVGDAFKCPPNLMRFEADLNDFSDTAALINCLDLVVTVDTSIAHLSCALGKKTYILLPDVPDWRWLMGRQDSPWYHSAKLYRQRSMGDWTNVFSAVSSDILLNFFDELTDQFSIQKFNDQLNPT
ncbi:MAG: tetratricopeptide repeat-containing glycosyltransferase family protein [Polynucleobacter sp.]